MFSKAFFSTVAATALFAGSASAICPGYNFGITQTGSNTNPDYGIFGMFDCSPAPITFTGLHLDGLKLAGPTLTPVLATATLSKPVAAMIAIDYGKIFRLRTPQDWND
ncbi:hypothetical protein F5J12DRAFT_891637 [Pisolithus orientalis]|uniref:uncharacterized protein n=1 Tax=Pisolithus orientalis TaxID=936130 RepID=UPI0022248505|nr:uncharacterized protein F5J12DRAFT_891637 [Pisolithus orientalis]KAI6009531.1 hypothetical protein F5J12DRAFT_891637 [Pisolithus orientalis]